MATNYIVHAWPVVPASGYAGPQDYMFGPYNAAGAERVSAKCNEAGYDTEVVELIVDPSTMITNYER